MATGTHSQIDWLGWLRRWDAQQEGYVPEREARFDTMFEAMAELLPASFVAIDLACGPGSISQRLLTRFPEARAIAVDIDPVMLAIGRGAVGTFDGRLRWVEADLAQPDWPAALGETQVDAVLSATALHWLWPEPLTAVYRDLGRLVRPGGLVLNADHLAFGPAAPNSARLSQRVLDEQWTDAAFAARGIETAEQWWEALSAEPAFASLLAERTARFAGKQRQESPPGFDVHVAALRAAGFREVETIWQILSNRVLLAVR
ncbi:class I SAM-dependent methyltransferase [Amycolatopsis ultiminotia]|uniref:Class I SAM-dependent methyltransferase n=1 Tax=Amycolatopsis ultiminotia TaxID=543629 RepID=A0ABP6WCH0_9PSEU